jgi:hypothetical protein
VSEWRSFAKYEVPLVPGFRHPAEFIFQILLPLCPLRTRGIQKHPAELRFGESGKNFIEIGKRPKVQETMLRVTLTF